MNHSSQKHDLTIANVQRWREAGVRVWTQGRTRTWWMIRERGGVQAPQRRRSLFEWIWSRPDPFFTALIIIVVPLLLAVFFQVIGAFASGRVHEILQAMKVGN